MKSHTLIRYFAFAGMLLASGPLLAQGGDQGAVSLTQGSGGGVSDGFLMGTHVFYYSDNSSLGGDALKDGSASFTRVDAQFNSTDWFSGIGFYYEQDKFGADQTDTITGLVLELVFGSFYAKIMPGFIEQKFTGRAFAKRSGGFAATELGIRANLIGGWAFYEVALQRRTQTITQEDGREMKEKYVKTETFPMLGMGVAL